MALAFETVMVPIVGGFQPHQDSPATPKATAKFPVGTHIRKAQAALKSFHVSYTLSDHHFFFERVAIRDMEIHHSEVHFSVFLIISDDSDTAGTFFGEVEVLVIADTE
jgi:hypothetical protein